MPPKKRTAPVDKANVPKIPANNNNTRIRQRTASTNKTQIPKQPIRAPSSSSDDDVSNSSSSPLMLMTKTKNNNTSSQLQQNSEIISSASSSSPFAIFVNGCQCEVQNPFGRIIPDQLFGPYILLRNISTNCILLPNGIDGSIQVEKNGAYVTVRFEGSNLVEAPFRGGPTRKNNNNNTKGHDDDNGCFVEDEFLVPFAPAIQRDDDCDERDERVDNDDGGDENKDKKQKAVLASRQQQKLKNSSSVDLLVPELTIQAAVYDAEKFAFEQNILANEVRQLSKQKNEKVVVDDDKNKGKKQFEQQLADFVEAEKKSSLRQRKR